MGICIYYDRILEVENMIAAAVSENFQKEVVASACLQKELLIVGALDNPDHNLNSIAAVNAFHGTGINLFQFLNKDNPGESRPLATLSPCGSKRHHLPQACGVVVAVALMS